MSDLELDRTAATNWREYKTEFLQMRDMVFWVWNELVSREGKAFMRRMIGWMALSCMLTVVLPLMFGRITDLLDPRLARLRALLMMLGAYGALMLLRQWVRYRQGMTREYLAWREHAAAGCPDDRAVSGEIARHAHQRKQPPQ
ncbi:MAG TPA: hypothetical protein VFY29_00740 [Terriglobia bacterium]|nr:hypothetical protein [Terriglobia bacterium]